MQEARRKDAATVRNEIDISSRRFPDRKPPETSFSHTLGSRFNSSISRFNFEYRRSSVAIYVT
jgi:hypothetical protein